MQNKLVIGDVQVYGSYSALVPESTRTQDCLPGQNYAYSVLVTGFSEIGVGDLSTKRDCKNDPSWLIR